MLYTEQNVKDNIRNRHGKRVFYLGKEDTLTPAAADYLKHQGIAVLDAAEAAVGEYRLQGGGYMREKPEHMTHLQADLLVAKTHPRIVFRGEMDALQAEIMLCQLKVTDFREELGQILELCKSLISSDVLDEPLPEKALCGMTAQQIRDHSHFPQKYYGQPHFAPSFADGEQVLLLNHCRATARRAEIAAVGAFVDHQGQTQREDILRTLNRVSSMLYILMIRLKRKTERS